MRPPILAVWLALSVLQARAQPPESGPASVEDTNPAVSFDRDSAAPASARATPPAAPGGSAPVLDSLDLGTTSITGNQELPKVLSIVPWKPSELGELTGRPLNTLLEEALAPLDPEVFSRQLTYYDSLYGAGQED